MLHFSHFQKSYGVDPIIAIADLSIAPGIHWVKGVNGSGKSTLLKAIAGILPFDGDIQLNNVSLKQNPIAYKKHVNFAEAEPVFPTFLTGKEMIDLFAHAKSAPLEQATYFIESMNIQSYLNQPLGMYSSGMLKKLSLVLAFLGKPHLILLDEPLITLDVESLAILYQWIVAIHKKDGVSFMLSSHQPLESLSIADILLVQDRTLLLAHGDSVK